MSTAFVIGDNVQLKSGGPVMTIENLKTSWNADNQRHEFNGSYTCQWFAGKKLERDSFPHDSLNVVN